MANTSAMRKARKASNKSNVVALNPMKALRAEYAPKIEDATFRMSGGAREADGFLRVLESQGAVKSLADLLEVKTPFRIGMVRDGAGLTHDEAVLACNRGKKSDTVKTADAAFRQAWSRTLKRLNLDWVKYENRGRVANSKKRGANKRKEESAAKAKVTKETSAPQEVQTPREFKPKAATSPVDARLFLTDMRGLFLRYINESAKVLEMEERGLLEAFAEGVKALSASKWADHANATNKPTARPRKASGK